MATYTGGLRARLIWDNLFDYIEEGLRELGWFQASDDYKPIFMIAEPWDNLEEIPANTLTVVPENLEEITMELGSMLTEHHTTYWVEFLAENSVVGTHLIYDVKDLIEGRMGSIGYSTPDFWVYDRQQATPPTLFKCLIEDVKIDHGRVARERWKSTWFSCSFIVVDEYNNESD